jgi:hypothetical protein
LKLYLIEFSVKLKQGKDVLTVQDKMIVPGTTEKTVRAFFLETVQRAPAILLRFNDQLRIMTPIRDMEAEVSITSCVKQ